VGAPVAVPAMTGVKANRNTAAAIHALLNMTAPTGDLFQQPAVIHSRWTT
jgi:hypothetical protein